MKTEPVYNAELRLIYNCEYFHKCRPKQKGKLLCFLHKRHAVLFFKKQLHYEYNIILIGTTWTPKRDLSLALLNPFKNVDIAYFKSQSPFTLDINYNGSSNQISCMSIYYTESSKLVTRNGAFRINSN